MSAARERMLYQTRSETRSGCGFVNKLTRCAALALAFLGNAALADAPPVDLRLVRDLNTTPGRSNSEPHAFVTIGANVYFAAYTPATGIELFRTNGSASGLRFVHDFEPGPMSSQPNVLGAIGQRVIVESMTPGFVAKFWSVGDDGSAVRLPIDGYEGWFSSNFTALGTVGGLLALDSERDTSLWLTDGTLAGTKNLTADTAFPMSAYRAGFCSLGNRAVLFGSSRADGRFQLVATDGTAAGSTVLASLDGYPPYGPTPSAMLNGVCYLQLQGPDGWRLWARDGTPAGTREVASAAGFESYGLVAMGGNLYVAGVSDNQFRVARHAPGGAWAETLLETTDVPYAVPFLVVDNRLVFVAPYDPAQPSSLGLYLSDGTGAGTRRVYPTATVNDYVNTPTVIPLNGVVVFAPSGSSSSWRVDLATGTLSPTPLSAQSLNLGDSARLGNRLVAAGSGDLGIEAWTTDGTPQGTLFLHDVWATTNNGVSTATTGNERAMFGSAGNVLYFNGTIGDYATDLWNLWRTDGTVAGTRRLLPDRYDGRNVTAFAARSDGVVFRSGEFFGAGARYWKADTNLDAATPVTSTFSYTSSTLQRNGDDAYFMCPGTSNSPGLCRITPAAQALLLRSQIGTVETFVPIGNLGGVSVFSTGNGMELWRTDGTLPGTFRLAQEVLNTVFEGVPVPSAVANGKLFVAMCRNIGGCGLMATDGTVAGTAFVADLPDTDIGSMAAVGNRVLFTRRTNGASQLWSSDGTAAGTGIVYSEPSGWMSEIAVTGATAHIAMYCNCINDYLVTDGTAAGTRARRLPDGLLGWSSVMFSIGNAAVFSCRSNAAGTELCIADSRGESIRLFADLYPGVNHSFATYVGRTDDAAYIVADDGYHGRELWTLRVPDAIFANGFEADSR